MAAALTELSMVEIVDSAISGFLSLLGNDHDQQQTISNQSSIQDEVKPDTGTDIDV